MPAVEILAVGTELLLGQLADTNSAFVAQRLAENGVDVFAMHAAGDNRARIAVAIQSALERGDGVISTGGLGPTIDDVTKEAVCDALGIGTELHEPSLRHIQASFARIGREMRENNRKQAEVPAGSSVLKNTVGTAPGFVVTRADGKFVACMPGVPSEMHAMLTGELVPWLQRRFDLHEAVYTRALHTIGIAESEIDHRIADLFAISENPKVAVLAHGYSCTVKLMAKAASRDAALALIDPLQREIEARLDGTIFGRDDESLASSVLDLLQRSSRTLSVAESCTGGSVCAAFAAVPGASRSFAGGIVAYANEVKTAQLGVEPALIAEHGAVSEPVALAMAQGARARLDADFGVAITGIAGPGGGTAEKPVGLVWIAVAGPAGARVRRFDFPGDRGAVQARATVSALGLLWKTLQRKELISA